MALPNRGFAGLPAEINAVGVRVEAGLLTASPRASAAMLTDCASTLRRLASQTRQAALTAQAAVLHPKAV